MSEEEFQELKEILMDHLGRKEPRQRLVEQDELRGYLEHSWIYKGENGGKPIVERIPGAREPPWGMEETARVALKRNLEMELEKRR